MTVMNHPVLELLAARRDSGSRPSQRTDPWRVAVAIEGGGMRGVISAAMAQALDAAGLTASFDLVVGTSSGAFNAAALLGGVIEGCVETYCSALTGRRFINPWRLLAGRPALDMAWALGHASPLFDAERHRRTVESPIELHCVAVDVDRACATDLTRMTTTDELQQALLASSRLPWVAGPPVELGGHRYLDGGLAEPVPLDLAVAAGATHVLVLQTRPAGARRERPPGPLDAVVRGRLRALNPKLVDLYMTVTERQDRVEARIGRLGASPGPAPPHVVGLRPSGPAAIDRFERRPPVLREAARAAARDLELALSAGGSQHRFNLRTHVAAVSSRPGGAEPRPQERFAEELRRRMRHESTEE
jgi:predicted patatin/cPLA2 family phospholipase